MIEFLVIVLAVELMLDAYDRAISDRYKLIDYREADSSAEVAGLSDFFFSVSIPCMLGSSYAHTNHIRNVSIVISFSPDVADLPVLLLLEGEQRLLQAVPEPHQGGRGGMILC